MTLANRLGSVVIADVIRVSGGGKESFDVLLADVDARAKVFDAGLRVSRLPADVSMWFQPVSATLDADLHRRTRGTRQRH